MFAANAEKDFLDYLVVRWTAQELIGIAGNRLRTFLDLYDKRARATLGLPREHDPRDHEAADLTLRALLPKDPITNGFGHHEDTVAYLLRTHPAAAAAPHRDPQQRVHGAGLPDSGIPWAVTAEAVRVGTQTGRADDRRQGCSRRVPALRSLDRRAGDARRLANRLTVLLPARRAAHDRFNQEGITKITGQDFDDFRDMLIKLGVLGSSR